MPTINPLQDLHSFHSGQSPSRSSSSSVNYDYTGQALANKYGEQLGSLRASHNQALMDDPLSARATGSRIRDLQRYLSAYKRGGNLPDQEVIPGVRIDSQTESNNTGESRGPSFQFHDPMRMHLQAQK